MSRYNTINKTDTLDKDINIRRNEHEAFKSLVRYLVIREPDTINLRLKDLTDIATELKQEFNL